MAFLKTGSALSFSDITKFDVDGHSIFIVESSQRKPYSSFFTKKLSHLYINSVLDFNVKNP